MTGSEITASLHVRKKGKAVFIQGYLPKHLETLFFEQGQEDKQIRVRLVITDVDSEQNHPEWVGLSDETIKGKL